MRATGDPLAEAAGAGALPPSRLPPPQPRPPLALQPKKPGGRSPSPRRPQRQRPDGSVKRRHPIEARESTVYSVSDMGDSEITPDPAQEGANGLARLAGRNRPAQYYGIC
eukprot:gene13787-biopygen20066